MLSKSIKTQQKLVDDAISIIRRTGGLTLRELAENDEFNIAAVNYHFKDKDNFNRAIIMKVYEELFHWIRATDKVHPSETRKESARSLAHYTVRFLVNNRGIVRYWLTLKLNKQSDNTISLQELLFAKHKELFNLVLNHIRKLYPDDTEDKLFARFTMIYSGLVMPIVYGKERNTEEDKAYIDMHADIATELLLL